MTTIPSHYYNQGLCITSTTPIWGTRGIVDDAIAGKASAYNHEWRANMGPYQAHVDISDRVEQALNWAYYGLGSDISVYSESLSRVWRGFVNVVSFRIGTNDIKAGPFLDIINSLSVSYQTISYNTNPPVGGTQAVTEAAEELDSQDIYGVLQGKLSGGSGSSSEIEALRDSYLEESAWPPVAQSLSFGGGGELSLSLDLSGYGSLLEKYSPVIATTGEGDASAKIAAVLAQEPNGLFSNTALISENTLQVGLSEDGSKTALAVIKEIVAKGDASNNKWLFYIDTDLSPVYTQAPSNVAYNHALSDSEQAVRNVFGIPVSPWSVRAGYWVNVTDFVSMEYASSISRRANNIFIESAKFSTPFNIQLNGDRASSLSQRMAKLGIGGSF